jgi:hypothetical protein
MHVPQEKKEGIRRLGRRSGYVPAIARAVSKKDGAPTTDK